MSYVDLTHLTSRRIRGIHCRTCGKYFSERKGTVLEHSRLPEEKVESLLEHLHEGCGVRQTSRLIHVNQNTVTRYVTINKTRKKNKVVPVKKNIVFGTIELLLLWLQRSKALPTA